MLCVGVFGSGIASRASGHQKVQKGETPMRRLSSLTLGFATTTSLMILTAYPKVASADVTLYDKDGWTFHTTGLIAAHYQLVKGDADPLARASLAGGRIL